MICPTHSFAKNRKNPANRQWLTVCIAALLLPVLLAVQPHEAQAQRLWRLLIDAETFSVAVNPQNHRTMYVGGSARRLYRSYDAGQTWDTLVVDFLGGSGWFSNVFVHPIDTNVVLIGGSQFGTVQRSTDNGKTWTKVIDPFPQPPITLNGEVIIANPNFPDTMYLGGLSPSVIYRSADRGQTWDSISIIEDIPFLCTLTMRPDSTNIIFAGCADGEIRKSEDGGVTWRVTTKIENVVTEFESIEIPKIVFSTLNPLVGYATTTCFAAISLPNGGIYRTVDGGETWRHFAMADTSMWAIAVGENNGEDELFIGGFGSDHIPGAGVVRHSTNAGALWLDIDDTIPWVSGVPNVWMMKLFSQADRERPLLYMATEAGFFVYDDLTVSVQEHTTGRVAFTATPEGVVVLLPDDITGSATLRCFDILGGGVALQTVHGPGLHRFPVQSAAGRYIFQVVYNGRIIGSELISLVR